MFSIFETLCQNRFSEQKSTKTFEVTKISDVMRSEKRGRIHHCPKHTESLSKANLNLLGWKSKLVYWLKPKLSKNWMMFTNRLRGVLYHSQLKLSLLWNALVLRIITIPYNLSHIYVWFCSPHHSVLNCIVNNNSDLSNWLPSKVD